MSNTPSPYAAIRHCDIYRAKDAQYYARLETAIGSEVLLNYGPFETAATALAWLQTNHAIGDNFFLDDSGRRSVPTDLQP
ncbi:hypothetical protein Q5H92_20230 [Hymenobacter sp. M29]|uniref:Uncharacterized protein n=1 Tax=Hymenobacter mellowenesis TaxID=3063995 RepID=A0ABT9AHW6_9BACT|nr:hypothetical protein [Hymenobacter sp. M29]MDO7848705.1 hypothetical protein [Hymenobacter sp. M29]